MRLAHAMADTLVTPINNSFLDFNVLGAVDPATHSVTGESHYSEMVRNARRKRRQLDGASTDWIVVRNRLSMLESRNKQLVVDGLNELSLRLGFRSIDDFTEREVYREFYPRGLTALDHLDEELGTRPSLGHVRAREEITSLLRQLKLPIDARGRRRAATGPNGSGRSTSHSKSMTSSTRRKSDFREANSQASARRNKMRPDLTPMTILDGPLLARSGHSIARGKSP